jgi:tetratricopeptide (TPR) repeat protein
MKLLSFALLGAMLLSSPAFADPQQPPDPAPGEWRTGAKEVPAALDDDPISMVISKAMAHELVGNYDLAAKEFGMAIARFPERVDFRRNRCWAYVMAELHYDLAVTDCSKAIDLKTEQSKPDADLFFLRAQAYEGNRQYQSAIADYDRAASMGEKNDRLLLYRCETRAQWGQDLGKGWNDCIAYFYASHGDARSHEAMSLIRWRLKDYAMAASEADKSIAIYAKRAPALYLRGIAKRGAGNANGGNIDIASAKAIDPKIAETYAGYGVAP